MSMGASNGDSAGGRASPATLLISDLHLESGRPDITRAFLDFLATRAAGARALYILGDFFNLWIGDDDTNALTRTVTNALSSLTNSGTPVYFMPGNRDFLVGRAFLAGCGAAAIPEPTVLECHGRRYLLMHGDSLCTRDTEYMAFRRKVRDPRWQREFLARPLAERRAFADEARAQSKAMGSNKSEDIMDVTQAEVEKVMRRHGADILIHGHTHRPAVHDFTLDGRPARRIVLGDWEPKGRHVSISEGGARLSD